MKIVALVCNVILAGFLFLVMLTDGTPENADLPFALLPLVMPVFNVVVLNFIPIPRRAINIVAMVGDTIWFVLSCWLIVARYPSHPEEAGLLTFVVLLALTPVLSSLALYLNLRASGTPRTT